VRLAVVGHVEWVDFVRVPCAPRQGEIISASEAWQEAAGGGADAAVQLLKLAGAATLFTALGDDDLGRRAFEELSARGLRVETAWRREAQRRAVCFLDDAGERTITLFSPKLVPLHDDPLPWDELAATDGVYFSGGDPAALQAARQARTLVASARELPTLREAGVRVDALVASANDAGELYESGDVDPPPGLVVRTDGAHGGTIEPGGAFAAAVPPGKVVDSYGAGDAFAAGLTYALAARRPVAEAVAFAARCGAAALTGRGPFEGQLTL
jgi:ribokinase